MFLFSSAILLALGAAYVATADNGKEAADGCCADKCPVASAKSCAAEGECLAAKAQCSAEGKCSAQGEKCCAEAKCVKEGEKCCAEGKCAKEGEKCCAEGKCAKEGEKCCAEDKCCAEGAKCCAEGKKCCIEGTCCAEGKKCCTDKAKCPVSGKAVNAEASVDYKGGKVFFCCNGCAGAFQKDVAKFANKANHQLVVTGQAQQCGCPYSGGGVNAETAIDVDGAKVGFCCGGCKGKAEKADCQITALFSDEAFAKAYKVGGAE